MEEVKLPYSTIKEAWDFFSERVIHKSAPEIQRVEMKKAFYTGASACFDIISFGTDGLSEHEGVLKVEKIHQEFVEFAKTLKKG